MDSKVDKEMYLQICKEMGKEPKEEEMPIGMEDFPFEIQGIFQIYYQLSDRWEGMSGTYMGKDWNLIPFIFEINDIITKEEKKYYFNTLVLIDAAAKRYYSDKQKQTRKANEARGKKANVKRA